MQSSDLVLHSFASSAIEHTTATCDIRDRTCCKLQDTRQLNIRGNCKMAYIKQEPSDMYDDYEEYGRARQIQNSMVTKPSHSYTSFKQQVLGLPAPLPAQYPANRGGELCERSRQVRQAKRYRNYPESLMGDVFETTGMVVGSTACLRVTHMLIDTGASSIFISAAAAREARLTIRDCKPRTFDLADGSQVTHNQLARFKLYMSGIYAKVIAFIDKGNPGHHILLGKTGIKAFNASANFSYGRKKETRWVVAQDKPGERGKKVLLEEDPANRVPTMIPYGLDTDLELAMVRGETAKQRNGREILERIDKKREKLYQKHKKNVIKKSDLGDFPDRFGYH
ncbi:hypothetical protein BST61_g536 [Cercospora zeina]